MKKMICTALIAIVTALALAQEPEIIAYPTKGQDAAQQDRDLSACAHWAPAKSGYDEASGAQPAKSSASSVQSPVETLPRLPPLPTLPGLPPPPWQVNSSSPQASAAMVDPAQQISQAQRDLQGESTRQRQHVSHLRAMAACMEGRGYVVK